MSNVIATSAGVHLKPEGTIDSNAKISGSELGADFLLVLEAMIEKFSQTCEEGLECSKTTDLISAPLINLKTGDDEKAVQDVVEPISAKENNSDLSQSMLTLTLSMRGDHSIHDAMIIQEPPQQKDLEGDVQPSSSNATNDLITFSAVQYIPIKTSVSARHAAVSEQHDKNNAEIGELKQSDISASKITEQSYHLIKHDSIAELQQSQFLETLKVTVPLENVSLKYTEHTERETKDQHNVVSQIMLKTKSLGANKGVTHLKMTPPQLGQLDIIFTNENNNVSVSLVADKWEGYSAIAQNIEHLKSCIEASMPDSKLISLNLDLKEHQQQGRNQNREESQNAKANFDHTELEKELELDTAYDSIYSINIAEYRVNIVV
ncbi:flagellar hook-length control protein FliK [Candidatus Lariskella endosymbiont of Epinotia ramella]|uniref:flagellar hook-length control protein FliK n=1 Tax=Candidatus Lariskella endosymbiont of Epinotia ramella TaxID=3066224 RepID=UPI0030CA89B4